MGPRYVCVIVVVVANTNNNNTVTLFEHVFSLSLFAAENFLKMFGLPEIAI